MSRFVRPATRTLTLANGDTLVVKERLTAGEHRAAMAQMYLAGVDGTLKVNPLQTGVAQITAYLLDWSLTDEAGQPVVIRGVSTADLIAALDSLSPEDFAEIRTAIDQHETAMAQAREDAKKKTTAGTTPSDPTSASPSAAAGVSSGSVS